MEFRLIEYYGVCIYLLIIDVRFDRITIQQERIRAVARTGMVVECKPT